MGCTWAGETLNLKSMVADCQWHCGSLSTGRGIRVCLGDEGDEARAALSC
jgi:hypothetical protein